MNEGQWTQLLKSSLEKEIFVFKVAGSYYQKRGIPDLILVDKGVTYWVEIKLEDRIVESLQKQQIRQLKKAGANVCVCRVSDKNLLFQDEGGKPLASIKYSTNASIGLAFMTGLKMCFSKEYGDVKS